MSLLEPEVKLRMGAHDGLVELIETDENGKEHRRKVSPEELDKMGKE